MSTRFYLPAVILIALISLGCSSGQSPVLPDESRPNADDSFSFVHAGENTIILGAWTVLIDYESKSVEAVPIRTAEIHVDVTVMIKPPRCYNCFLAKNLSFNSDTQILTIDIGFRNPSNITGYDVRGIVTEFGYMEFLNPDGYTDLFSPTSGVVNPFAAYDTGIGQREFEPYGAHYETLEIYNPTFPQFPPFTYVVEASWPDNCKEPYEVKFDSISRTIPNDGETEAVLRVYARDWQDNVSTVSVDLTDLGQPTLFLEPAGAIEDLWQGPVKCSPGVLPGDYEVLVTATTAPPFDQTSDIYNYLTLTVVEAQQQESEPEVFGMPERVAMTPGESFIWPRHAIAVTDNGVSHVVWIDNSPDPESNEFHVYYSNREGGVWSPAQQIDSEAGIALYATIVADSTNAVHVVWEDERDYVLGSDIYYASSNDGFLTETPIVSGANGFRNVHPKIVAGEDDTLHVAWHSLETVGLDEFEYDLWYTKRPFGAPGWESALSIVSQEDVVESYPSIAPGPFGTAYIAFQSDESGTMGIYFTGDQGGSFGLSIPVSLTDAYQPGLDVTPEGDLVLAYFDYVDGSWSDVYYRYSDDMGATWGSPQAVSASDDAYQYAPDVECTPEGDIHFAWHEENELGYPSRVLYREYLADEGWQDIIELAGQGYMGAFPSMDSDAQGHIHVVYELWTLAEPPDVNNYEIWYRNSVP